MTGYYMVNNVVVITWCYQSYEKVTILVTEDEYSAVVEVCC